MKINKGQLQKYDIQSYGTYALHFSLKNNSGLDKKNHTFLHYTNCILYLQYTQSAGVNICSFGVIKLQNPNLHLSSITPPLSQPFNP